MVTAPAGAQSFPSVPPDLQYDLPTDIHEPMAIAPVTLTTREQEAVVLSKGWQDKYSPAMLGRHGQVIYHYGEASAPVITAPNNVTHIQLERGERLVTDGIFIGDTVNWKIFPVLQGLADTAITHIVIKPLYAHLETTMIAITDRRSYYFHLKSTEAQFMASVGFEYPQIEREYWSRYEQAANARQRDHEQRTQIRPTPDIAQDIAELDFGYRLSGDTPAWKPVRVYNDGKQVFVQMPRAMQQSDAPAFVELGQGDTTQIVNYRLRRGTYIIDKLFDLGMLIAGTGRNQRKVIITYTGDGQ